MSDDGDEGWEDVDDSGDLQIMPAASIPSGTSTPPSPSSTPITAVPSSGASKPIAKQGNAAAGPAAKTLPQAAKKRARKIVDSDEEEDDDEDDDDAGSFIADDDSESQEDDDYVDSSSEAEETDEDDDEDDESDVDEADQVSAPSGDTTDLELLESGAEHHEGGAERLIAKDQQTQVPAKGVSKRKRSLEDIGGPAQVPPEELEECIAKRRPRREVKPVERFTVFSYLTDEKASMVKCYAGVMQDYLRGIEDLDSDDDDSDSHHHDADEDHQPADDQSPQMEDPKRDLQMDAKVKIGKPARKIKKTAITAD